MSPTTCCDTPRMFRNFATVHPLPMPPGVTTSCPFHRALAVRPAALARHHSAPRGHWFFGHLSEMRDDILNFVVACERNHGPLTRLRMYATNFYLVNDPDLIETILVRNHRDFDKPTGLRVVRPMFGDGLLTADEP